jgi:hypothetical protein
MYKEKFQEYLYNPDSYLKADLSELADLTREFPWFSSAGIILLLCCKMQSDPDFDSHLRKNSIHIPNRRLLQKMLESVSGSVPFNNKPSDERPGLNDFRSRIPGILDSQEVTVTGDDLHSQTENTSVLDDDSLLDFAYFPGKLKSEASLKIENRNPGKADFPKVESLESNIPNVKSDEGKQNFDHWISKLGGNSESEKSPYKKHEIIESFIHSDPGVIRADKETMLQGDIAKYSAEENEGFITDTLAKIYVKQGLYHKAIYAYEKLCLKYPEKSIYFASQIEEIKSLYIKK